MNTMFSYPSALLLMSFFLIAMAGYFKSRRMFDVTPLVFAGFVKYLPLTMHFINASALSYIIYLYLFYIFSMYKENRYFIDPFILPVIYFDSSFLSNMVFGKIRIGEDDFLKGGIK